MASCAGNWWQAPVYFTAAVLLAFLAISATIHSLPKDDNGESLQTKTDTTTLSFNASKALRKSGFNIIATILQIVPEIFLSSPNSTIFAIQDCAISNTTHPPWLLKHLFLYHTSSVKLSLADILNKTQGSCLPTLLDRKNLSVTKIDSGNKTVEINHIPVTHPDIFLEGPLSIHGVLGPFTPLNSPQGDTDSGEVDFFQSPICDSISEPDVNRTENLVEWNQIIRLLSSHGLVSFAIGLHSVIDRILEDGRNLSSATIFAPPDFSFVASSSALLDRIVRFHVVSQRLNYSEFADLPDKALLETLVTDRKLEISRGVNPLDGLSINGAIIIAPDIFSSEKFVVHGISRAFDVAELPKVPRWLN